MNEDDYDDVNNQREMEDTGLSENIYDGESNLQDGIGGAEMSEPAVFDKKLTRQHSVKAIYASPSWGIGNPAVVIE